ncbi:MAG: hypothetical protein M1588_03090 [Planctomycetes bacterium]|nr:hypothetical protein [Planctomycetota bacterium]
MIDLRKFFGLDFNVWMQPVMPMDILVVPQSRWERLKDVPGLIYRETARQGRIVYESK